MVNYPQTLPADAVQVVFAVATGGFAPDGQHADAACFYQALWNIQGYGLGVWKPHDHPDLKAGGKGAKAKKVTVPKTQPKQIEALAKALEPARQYAEAPVAAPPETGAGEAPADATANVGAGLDWRKLPWDKIIALIMAILMSQTQK